MSNPAVVPASLPGSYGVCVAFGQNWNTTTPTWTRLDDPTVAVFGKKVASPHNTNCVVGWSVDRGRAYELDKTQAGTATVKLEDPNGWFDPTNPGSPFYGLIAPMLRAKISMQNPSNGTYYDIFTGFIESWQWSMEQNESVLHVTVHLVDGFEPLTLNEIQPDGTGVTAYIGTSDVTTRITTLLDDAFWPDDGLGPSSLWRVINSGNVALLETVYNPETSFLSAIQDCCDAEFPGVANFFMRKNGAATFYGRYPRFQPTNFPNDVNFWQVADRGGADAFGAARIYDIEWAMDSTRLVNACLSYPNGIDQTLVAAQLVTDPASIAKYGTRVLSLTDLIVAGQPLSVSQPSATGPEVCVFYGRYYVQNYAQPQLRVSKLELHARGAGDSQTWAFLTGVEIGDLVTLFTSDPGGGGFGKETDGLALAQFYVEGVHYQVQPNSQSIPDLVLSLDVSPRAYFTNPPPWANP